jgi:hypothetical protein
MACRRRSSARIAAEGVALFSSEWDGEIAHGKHDYGARELAQPLEPA